MRRHASAQRNRGDFTAPGIPDKGVNASGGVRLAPQIV